MDKKQVVKECWTQLRLNNEQKAIHLFKAYPFLLDEHVTDHGTTFFQLSCLYGLLDVVNYLVEQGVNINQTDQYG